MAAAGVTESGSHEVDARMISPRRHCPHPCDADGATRFTVTDGAVQVEVFDLLGRQRFVNAYAGIALPNPASVALHEKLGFKKIGQFVEVAITEPPADMIDPTPWVDEDAVRFVRGAGAVHGVGVAGGGQAQVARGALAVTPPTPTGRCAACRGRGS